MHKSLVHGRSSAITSAAGTRIWRSTWTEKAAEGLLSETIDLEPPEAFAATCAL